MTASINVGVLALQGAFHEHLKLLRVAAIRSKSNTDIVWNFIEVRIPEELLRCDALIIPGGESTTIALVAARSGLLEPLREFVKVHRKPTWGTCAGLILLAESATRTKKGGQDLIGGLDVRVNRNYFGRQTESFEAEIDLPFLQNTGEADGAASFPGVFIRAPVVEKILPPATGDQSSEAYLSNTVVAPARDPRKLNLDHVEVMARLPGRSRVLEEKFAVIGLADDIGDIVAVRQGNVFGTSFHPELTEDARIHVWWLEQIKEAIARTSSE